MSDFAKRSSEMRRIIKNLSSIQIIMFAFLLVIIIGSILLSLPISSVNGKSVPYVDALFTATTATCVKSIKFKRLVCRF